MTEDEANEYGNVNYETAKEDKNYSGKWYFYECLYEITNNATFKMPMTGDDGKCYVYTSDILLSSSEPQIP